MSTKILSKNKYKTYVILSCYIYNNPRRLKDYSLMYLAETIDDTNDKTKNYYVTSKSKFVFNDHKTSSSAKNRIIKVKPELNKIIKEYIKTTGKTKGESLFDQSEKCIYSRLTKLFSKEFKRLCKIIK